MDCICDSRVNGVEKLYTSHGVKKHNNDKRISVDSGQEILASTIILSEIDPDIDKEG